MNWFIFSILAGFFFASARMVSRGLLREKGNAMAFTAIHDFLAGLVLLPFIFINLHFPQHLTTWLFFAGVVVFGFLCDWLAFVALKLIDVSLYQIVNQVRHIFILIGGLFLFAEAITGFKIIAVVLIIAGVVIALYQNTRFNINKGVAVTFLSTLFAVVAFLFVKLAVADFSEIAMASTELMLIGLLSFGFLRFSPRRLIEEINLQKFGLVICGLLFGLFEVFLFYALKLGEASRVIPVIQCSLIFTLLFSFIFLKERSHLLQKILGSVIVIIGIIFIYV